MELNSCLYECNVIHNRLRPKSNFFQYKIFTFYLDLDELEIISSSFKFFSFEKWNLFSFKNKDHYINNHKNLKNSIKEFVLGNGIIKEIQKVILITNIRVFGYVFNPVSFYYCFGIDDEPLCAVAEVNNTFGEQKMFFIENSNENKNFFYLKTIKHFYVSPFIHLDSEFEFKLNAPDAKLKIFIDSYKDNEKVLISTYTGNRKELTDRNLISLFIKYPLVTLRVIFLIHYQAIKLYLKKIIFIKKNDNLELQKGVYNGR